MKADERKFTKPQTGDTLPNGATLIEYTANMVLAKNEGATTPYVTWRYSRGDFATTYSGNYFNNLSDAIDNFNKRGQE